MTVIQMSGARPEIAFWLMSPNDDACDIAALLGYGTVIIDMEHGAFDMASASRSITVSKALALRVYTRVDSAERVSIQHALDFGSDGVILPQIADLAHGAPLPWLPAAPQGPMLDHPAPRVPPLP